MRNRMCFLVLCSLALPLFPATASAMARLTLAGVASSTKVKTSDNDFVADGLGYGGGALLDLDIGGGSSFEFGGFLKHRKFKTTVPSIVGDIQVNEDATTFEVPVMYHYWLAKVFALTGGMYYAKWNKIESKAFLVSDPSVAATVDTTSLGSDIGVIVGARAMIPLGFTSLMLDANYHQGLKSDKVSALEGMLGLTFGL